MSPHRPQPLDRIVSLPTHGRARRHEDDVGSVGRERDLIRSVPVYFTVRSTLRSSNKIAVAAEKAGSQPAHAAMPVRLVDAIGAGAQFANVVVAARLPIQP